jgi:hypothetical protein
VVADVVLPKPRLGPTRTVDIKVSLVKSEAEALLQERGGGGV